MTATGDSAGFLQSDLTLRYFGDPEEKILYVQDVPSTWDKVCFPGFFFFFECSKEVGNSVFFCCLGFYIL